MRQMTVREFYLWWIGQKRREIRRSTLHNYESSFRLHIVPAIGHLPLDAVKVRQVEDVLYSLVEEGKVATARNTKAALRSMYSDAIRWDEAATNPAQLARLPRGSHAVTVQRVPSLHEARTHPMAWASATTGLRWGELAAIQAKDVKLELGVVDVNKALYRGRIGPPKSPSSIRQAIILPEGTEWWAGFEPFRSPSGAYLTYSNWWKRDWKPTVGDMEWTPHDFRHTYATTLIERGLPVTVIAKMLGHSSPDVTLRVYAGFFDDSIEQARRLLTQPSG